MRNLAVCLSILIVVSIFGGCAEFRGNSYKTNDPKMAAAILVVESIKGEVIGLPRNVNDSTYESCRKLSAAEKTKCEKRIDEMTATFKQFKK